MINSGDIIIGNAHEGELDDLVKVLANAEFQRRYGGALGEPAEVIERAFTSGGLYTARLQGQPVGFVWIVETGTFGRGGYIRLIAISPDYRSMGVGRLLMQHAEGIIFSKSSHAFLLTSDFNVRAHQFYESLGWKKVGEIPGYVCEGINEFIFWKSRSEVNQISPA